MAKAEMNKQTKRTINEMALMLNLSIQERKDVEATLMAGDYEKPAARGPTSDVYGQPTPDISPQNGTRRAELERKLRAISTHASMMIRDTRVPLSADIGALQMMLDGLHEHLGDENQASQQQPRRSVGLHTYTPKRR